MRTLDQWKSLLAPTPRTIEFPHMVLASAYDQEPPIFIGNGQVRLPMPGSFEFTIAGEPTDTGDALQRLRRSAANPYDVFQQFRLNGTDENGREWSLGWVTPKVGEITDRRWNLTGSTESLSTLVDHGYEVHGPDSVELAFLAPMREPIGQMMARFVRLELEDKRSVREFRLSVLETELHFSYEPQDGLLWVTAPTSPALNHPFADGWLAEPLRILFGQLIFPRLVARNFQTRSTVWLRRSPKYHGHAGFAALWAAQVVKGDAAAFWKLYAGLLTLIAQARGADGHPDMQAHKITRFYEEIIQAARGSRWVWALTLASTVEGLAKMLFMRREKKAIHVLERLKSSGLLTPRQVASWREMRNSVMHGHLISPWSTAEEDERLLDLANLVHALTFKIVDRAPSLI